MKSELVFHRDYTRTDNWDRADAILHRALQTNEAMSLSIIGQLDVIKNELAFDLDKNITFCLLVSKITDRGVCEKLVFSITSTVLNLTELQEYTNSLLEKFLIIKKNNLGNKIYFFDQVLEAPLKTGPPKKIVFTKYPFVTNRTLDNMFHERQEEIKDRIEFFMNKKDWYDQHGFPYTLGLLLHGKPGTGKTTTIKAIANITKRHIVNINISGIKTRKQLKKLFYDDRIEVCENTENTANTTEYIIPIDKRIYVIEDIDAITTNENNILLKRDSNIVPVTPPQNKMQFTNEIDTPADLDLATVLNVIDGTLETPGRILIITSNFPQKLDQAFIRPGRMDLILEYTNCSNNVIKKMYKSFFGNDIDKEELKDLIEHKWTPAEVSQIMFKNFKNPKQAIIDLIKFDPKEYFKLLYTENEPSYTII
jgi:energy-coupling factor transporter ATP-binding protein EcfA2